MRDSTQTTAQDCLPTNPPALMALILAAFLCVEILLLAACLAGPHFGSDFIEFWSAARIGLGAHPADAYNAALLFKVEKLTVPSLPDVTPWFYPPTFYLAVLPFGLMSYKAAFWSFELLTLGCFVVVFRRITGNRTAFWCLAAFPGLWMNFLYGQNAFLTASLAAAALVSLKRRPALAGVFIGLLAIKPHLALLFPVALVAIGAWRAFASAAATAVTFTLVSAQVMGREALRASIGSFGHAREFLEIGVSREKMPIVFSFVRYLGASIREAYYIHAAVSVLVAVAVWMVWRRCDDWQLRGAVLMTATFLFSPYVQIYDLAWLAFPIAWLALIALRDGWLRGERAVLIAAWILPLPMASIATSTHIQIGPWVLAALLWITLRRAGVVPGLVRSRGVLLPLVDYDAEVA